MNLMVFVGTYTRSGKEPGIFLCRFDDEAPALTVESFFAAGENPSFLALDPSGRFLYTVNEMGYDDTGTPQGAVSAFALDASNGTSTLLSRQPTLGADPCHLTLDAAVRHLIVTNYRSGSIAVLPIGPDGSLGHPLQSVQHEGSGKDLRRQAGPHAHSVTLSEDNRFAFVADLGLDRVMIYRLDPSEGRLIPADPPFLRTTPGAGPRHMEFHPRGPWLYIINEMGSTVSTCQFDPVAGALLKLQEISSLPEHFRGKSSGADIHVAPDGRFLYSSNRGHDSIAIFEIDQKTGLLRSVGHESSGGMKPRSFLITPSGSHLLAANQGSDSVVVFSRDPETGLLDRTDATVSIPAPVCLKVWTVTKTKGEF